MILRVAACQILTYPDVKKSSAKIIHWIEKASEVKADVVAFPEACLCGYASGEEYWAAAKEEDFLAEEARITGVSKKLRVAVVLGTAYWEEGKIYNGILAVERDGTVHGRYAKTHLVETWAAPGKHLPIHSLAGVDSCFIICHDIRYPELVRLPVIAGARICYFCTNEAGLLHEENLSAYQAMPISRATENGIFLVMANAPANPSDMYGRSASHGNSKIIHPNGNVIEEAGYFEERLVVRTIDTDEATGRFAERSAKDESITKKWMNDGAGLVGR